MRGGPYREGVTLEGWREKFQKALASRFALRLHMTLLMALVMGTGVLSARLLRSLSPSMGLRYGVSVLVAYAAFFVLVRLWLRYASETLLSEAPREALPPEARALAGQLGEPVPEAVPDPLLVVHDDRGLLATQVGVDMAHAAVTGPPARFRGDPSVPDVSGVGSGPSSSGSSGDASGGSSGGGFSVDADEGVVVVVVVVAVVAVVAAVFGAAVMSVWQAPAILGEAAFEVVLAATLARAARRMEGRSWSRALWKATWGRALAVLIVAMAAGFAAQAVCPSATTMGEAVSRCVMARPTT
jgi:hypothetical protein